jgi:hypothetical protein
MEKIDKNKGEVLGEIGCRFMSIIESHIKDYELQKDGDFEWLLEPLDAISHSPDIVLDAFQYGNKKWSNSKLYFHDRDATHAYVAYDKPIIKLKGKMIGNTIIFDIDESEKIPEPNPYDKTMLIKDTLNIYAVHIIPPIWDNLVIQFTEVGVWQAVLLNEIVTSFPHLWNNCLQGSKTIVFSQADMQQIIDDKKSRYDYTDEEIERLNAYWRFLDMTPHFDQYKKSNYDKLVSYLECEDILPSVKISGDEAVVSYCYWNEWSGFCRATVPVERCGQSVTIGEHAHEVLVAYDRGISY